MGVVSQKLAVLAGPRLGLVGVDDQVDELGVLGDERPLHPGRKPGAAAPAQVRLLDLVGQRRRLQLQRLWERLKPATLDIDRQLVAAGDAEALGDDLDAHRVLPSSHYGVPMVRPCRPGPCPTGFARRPPYSAASLSSAGACRPAPRRPWRASDPESTSRRRSSWGRWRRRPGTPPPRSRRPRRRWSRPPRSTRRWTTCAG